MPDASLSERHEAAPRHRGATVEPGARAAAAETVAETMLGLQRAHGNRAVARMLEQDGHPAERVLARTRKDTMLADFGTARAAGHWNTAVQALAKLGRADILTALTGLPAADLASLDQHIDAVSKTKASLVHRCIRFVSFAPPDAVAHAAQFAVTDTGKRRDSEKVPGGNVEVRTGVGATIGANAYDAGFTMGYTGTDSGRARWLQFIWREIVVYKPHHRPQRLNDQITTSGGTYHLTTDPDKPNYNTDSSSAASPFYEGGFVSNRTADSTTMFDRPSSMQNIVTPQFAGATPATKVISRAHFVTYLVQGMDIVYSVKTDVEWVYTDANEPARTNKTRGAGPASRLSKRQRDRLIAQYPNFDYLP